MRTALNAHFYDSRSPNVRIFCFVFARAFCFLLAKRYERLATARHLYGALFCAFALQQLLLRATAQVSEKFIPSLCTPPQKENNKT